MVTIGGHGHATEVVSLARENVHVMVVVSLMEGEWSYYRGGLFNGGEWSCYRGGH